LRLLYSEIYKRGLYGAGRVAVSKKVIRYGQWPRVP
jgi:hypothetical protein